MNRTNAVMVRLDDAQSTELNRMADGVGAAAATLAHSVVTAMIRCYRENGTLTLPLRMARPELPAPAGDPVRNDSDPAPPPRVAAVSSVTPARARPGKSRRVKK